jgi:hypothetical protein
MVRSVKLLAAIARCARSGQVQLLREILVLSPPAARRYRPLLADCRSTDARSVRPASAASAERDRPSSHVGFMPIAGAHGSAW